MLVLSSRLRNKEKRSESLALRLVLVEVEVCCDQAILWLADWLPARLKLALWLVL